MVTVEGGTVGECLDELIKQYPGMKMVLFDRDGKLFKLLNVFINRESAYPDELKKPVKDGDEISVVYTMVGG